jgi:hypothetical protein
LDFFQHNAERMSHAAAVEIFHKLAAEEQKHIEFIQGLLKALESGQPALETGIELEQADLFSQRAELERLDQTVIESLCRNSGEWCPTSQSCEWPILSSAILPSSTCGATVPRDGGARGRGRRQRGTDDACLLGTWSRTTAQRHPRQAIRRVYEHAMGRLAADLFR